MSSTVVEEASTLAVYLRDHVTSEEWRGDYLGVQCTVKRWERPEGDSDFNPTWNFYLWITEKQVPDGRWPAYWLESGEVNEWGRVAYPYSDSFLANLRWHGCMNYYAKYGIDGGPQRIEIGCDYAHLWNVERGLDSITFEEVVAGARDCIESLREHEPGLLWRCVYNGQFYPEEQGELLACGAFLSRDAAEKNPEFAQNMRERAEEAET